MMRRLFNTRFNADPPDDDDTENFGAFMNYLGRATKDPKWLETVKGSLSSAGDKIAAAPQELAGFLGKQVEKLEMENSGLRTKLEQARDLLTPEQLIQWRSAQSGGGGDPPKPKPSDPPPPPPAPTPPAKPKRKWL